MRDELQYDENGELIDEEPEYKVIEKNRLQIQISLRCRVTVLTRRWNKN